MLDIVLLDGVHIIGLLRNNNNNNNIISRVRKSSSDLKSPTQIDESITSLSKKKKKNHTIDNSQYSNPVTTQSRYVSHRKSHQDLFGLQDHVTVQRRRKV